MTSVPSGPQHRPVTGGRRGRLGSRLPNNDRFLQGSKSTSMADNLTKTGTQIRTKTRQSERERLPTAQRSLAATSYSWVLVLRLRCAGRCNFSFGDYKIHVPKGKKTQRAYYEKAKVSILWALGTHQVLCFVHQTESLWGNKTGFWRERKGKQTLSRNRFRRKG